MKTDTEEVTSYVEVTEAEPTRRPWTKPEAKAAEVARATLTGFAVPPITDFSTCAS
jgi:hypothetical protein